MAHDSVEHIAGAQTNRRAGEGGEGGDLEAISAQRLAPQAVVPGGEHLLERVVLHKRGARARAPFDDRGLCAVVADPAARCPNVLVRGKVAKAEITSTRQVKPEGDWSLLPGRAPACLPVLAVYGQPPGARLEVHGRTRKAIRVATVCTMGEDVIGVEPTNRRLHRLQDGCKLRVQDLVLVRRLELPGGQKAWRLSCNRKAACRPIAAALGHRNEPTRDHSPDGVVHVLDRMHAFGVKRRRRRHVWLRPTAVGADAFIGAPDKWRAFVRASVVGIR